MVDVASTIYLKLRTVFEVMLWNPAIVFALNISLKPWEGAQYMKTLTRSIFKA